MKTACVTGITGQTGSYLCDLLLKKGYKVYGLKRRSSSFNTGRLKHVYTDLHDNNQLELIYGDLSDYSSLVTMVNDIKPDLFFNLGAQSISEKSILPIMTSLKIDHLSFKELWERYAKKISIENIDGVDVEIVTINNSQLKAMGY